MSRFVSWETPLPFVETDNENKLVINSETAKLLQNIMQPVVVVAIAGSYRTGKSYLMNRLAGKQHGFELGSELQSKTKGIWIWCCQHPNFENEILVLIDTEGLSDPEKASDQNDMMIFSLAVLLSSTFVFNAVGKIDQEMINKLYFVTEITENIKVKSKKDDSDEENEYQAYLKYFPAFVLAVRDFTLELKINGNDVTPNEYFDYVLNLKKGNTKGVVSYNLPREAIRNAFKTHQCFVFTRPVMDEALFPKLEELPESSLSPTFLDQSHKFCKYIHETSQVKKMEQGHDVTGRMLLTMTEHYVQSINMGAVPCIESTVHYVRQHENQRIHMEAVDLYKKEMRSALEFPVSVQILDTAHERIHKMVLEYFRKRAVLDDKGSDFINLTEKLLEEFRNLIEHNEELSRKKCMAVIESIYKSKLLENIKNKTFVCAGGYKLYENTLQDALEHYSVQTNNEIKAEEVKLEFLNEIECERMTIMIADSSMTEMEKECETSRKLAEAAKDEMRLQEEQAKIQEQRVEKLEIQHKEELQKMKEDYMTMEKKRELEMEELINSRLAEHEKLLREGHDRRARELDQEIIRLQNEKGKKSFFESTLDCLEKVTNLVSQFVSIRSMWKNPLNAAKKRNPKLKV